MKNDNEKIEDINIVTMYKIAEAILFNWYQMGEDEKIDIELPIKEIRNIFMFLPEKIKIKVMGKKIRKKL